MEQSSKIIQRALNDNYDYTRDYTVGAQTGEYVDTVPTLKAEGLLGMIQKENVSRKFAHSGTSVGARTDRSLTLIGPLE